MKRGARSIRGAMGTYFWVSLALLLVLGVVLWQGLGADDRGWVTLPTASAWSRATLDDGRSIVELRPGERVRVTPGLYRVNRFDGHGDSAPATVELDGTEFEIPD